jgi:hypothetical protein
LELIEKKRLYRKNKKLWPKANWICGDFLSTMEFAVIENKFRPAIINYDGVMQPINSSQYLKKILHLIDYNVPDKLILIANYILTNPYTCNSDRFKFKTLDILNELNKIYIMPSHWSINSEAFTYKHSRAVMGILVFIKQKHDPTKITIQKNYHIGA